VADVPLLLAAVLLVAARTTLGTWLPRSQYGWRFACSEVLTLATAIALALAIFALDCPFVSIPVGHGDLGAYTGLGRYPWYDQLAIWFSVFCATLWAVKAMFRILKPRTAAIGPTP
jgi:hypothetical protein